MRKHLIAVGIGAAVVSILAVGVAGAAASPEAQFKLPEGFSRAQDVAIEYATTVSSFPLQLPNNVKFPDSTPVALQDDVIYQEGVGESYAYFYWQCAWIAISLENGPDSDTTKYALTQLDQWDETTFFRDHVVEDGVTWEGTVLAAALRGDLASMSEYSTLNCATHAE